MFESTVIGPGTRRGRRLRRPLVARKRAPVYTSAATPEPPAPSAGGADAASTRASVRLADAVAAIDAGLDLLSAVDLEAEDGRAVLDATVELQRRANRLAALQLGVVGCADLGCAYLDDGAATLAAWLRPRTRLDAGECSRRVTAAGRLWRFPTLAAAARAGDVTAGHVTAVTSAAVPRRAEAVSAHDDTLTSLACHAPPRDVKVALSRIADHVDRDGVDRPSEPFGQDGRDPRCALWVRPGIDGLGEVQATLSQLDTEGLLTLLDALEVPDPPDTPEPLRRSAAQRRGDAFSELIRRALAHGLAPTVHGVKPQVLLALDLAALLPAADRGLLDLADLFTAAGVTEQMLRAAGVDPTTLHPTGAGSDTDSHPGSDHGNDDDSGAEANAAGQIGDSARNAAEADGGAQAGSTADRAPTPGEGDRTGDGDPNGPPAPRAPTSRPRARLRFTGDLHPDSARRLLDGAAVRCVLTMGPWRTVAVGRTFRTLPSWLRPLLDLVHHHCRGPDCDRPIPWTQAHHETAWVALGDTDVNQTIPLCVRHHDLVTTSGWDARLDPDTGVVTWTSPHGTIHHTRPPP